ncbi:response regulator [Nitratireductor pacificus]|uniref:Response regulator receiver protein n=1 Tax=Nitratireductor pacificus pht-3B TaxID=391937 RepID=K2LM10_9HYPH|nr:response regulator [Nitratireductor pacificus]EKF18809.1 response regulator receiver protein [Nitratireductor pacificus pht-3B]
MSGARVLLVEDEPIIAMNIEQLCREHGAADVMTVASFEALVPDILDAGKISTAILDIRLSDQWTDDFARLLQDRRIPFIFATGYAAGHQVFEPFAGIRIVEKPYNENDLIEALAAVWSGSLDPA